MFNNEFKKGTEIYEQYQKDVKSLFGENYLELNTKRLYFWELVSNYIVDTLVEQSSGLFRNEEDVLSNAYFHVLRQYLLGIIQNPCPIRKEELEFYINAPLLGVLNDCPYIRDMLLQKPQKIVWLKNKKKEIADFVRKYMLVETDDTDEVTENPYDAVFCECGKIHFTKEDDFYDAVESGKELVVVCTNCGTTVIRGADSFTEVTDDDCYTSYDTYTRSLQDNFEKAVELDMDNTHKVIFSRGMSVIMTTHQPADSYFGMYYDSKTEKPRNLLEEEWEAMRRKVNIEATVNMMLEEDKELKLKALSKYYIEGLDFSKYTGRR